MKHLKLHLASLLAVLTVLLAVTSSCVDEEEFPDTPAGNIEALWKIIDEHYCFHDYKQQEYGLDWSAIYNKYKVRAHKDMSRSQLFEVCSEMLSELRDGHVNLTAAHDLARYWAWYEDYPDNFSEELQRNYLGTDYRIASGLRYKILDDNTGYIYYASFSNGIGGGNLNEVLSYMSLCRGLIIDIRDNGGGDLTNVDILASRFTNERTHVGYIQHKTGSGHNDFSSREPLYLEPAAAMRWQKPVVVLTNRHVFSAANEFVMYMKQLPRTVIVGDKTGGGAGMPFTSSLPCGWTVRFSAVPTYDADGNCCEFGIEPDYNVAQTDEDTRRNRDTLIEFARRLLAE